ncbi:MAG: OmpH family outer membrane protein [Polyangiales bacterium]
MLKDSFLSFVSNERRRVRSMSAVAALAVAVAAPQLYAQVRIAVVDMQRALIETNDGRAAKGQLQKLFQARQDQLNTRQEALKRMKEDIEKQKNVVSREALEKRMSEYQAEFVKLQQSYLEYQQELAQKEAELTKSILVNLQGIVRQIGTSDGYTGILDQGAVIWSRGDLDLTDRVIQEYNTAHPTRPAAGGARPAGDAGTAPRPATPPARPPTAPGGPHPRPAP